MPKTLAKFLELWYHSQADSVSHYSLAVRTLASHAENRGSIPLSGTKKRKVLRPCVFLRAARARQGDPVGE